MPIPEQHHPIEAPSAPGAFRPTIDHAAASSLVSLLRRSDFVGDFILAGNGGNIAEVFSRLVSKLRDTIPYKGRDDPSSISPGLALEYTLLSLIKDRDTLTELKERVGGGILEAQHSANCIVDEARTKKFLTAVQNSVIAQRALRGTEPLHVIDAGCGSVPVLAIQAALTDPNLYVTALELNPVSAAMARQVIKGFGLEARIAVVEADAITFVPIHKAHIVVSETLQAGLAREPVVQIFRNLHQYLFPCGTLIPDSVQLSCGLISLLEEPSGYMATGKGDIPIDQPRWLEHREYRMGEPLERIEFDLPLDNRIECEDMAVVSINVRLGALTLEHNESMITFPHPVLIATPQRGEKPQQLIATNKSHSRLIISYPPGGIPIGRFE